jgi:hypothetical protein
MIVTPEPISGTPGSVPKQPAPDLWGALRASVLAAPGTDLAAPTGEVWEAEQPAANEGDAHG